MNIWNDLVKQRSANITYSQPVTFEALNPFMPTVQTFAVRETSVFRTANVGTVGKIGCENATVGKNGLKRNHSSLPLLTVETGPNP